MNFEDCSFFKVPSMKNRNLLYLYFRTWHPCHQNFRLKKPIVILTLFNDDNILTILIWSQESIMDKKYKRNAKLHCWEIQFGRFWTNPLEKLLWARATSERQNKSECERNKKHPTASSVSIRFWSTHQNWFSSRNSRENSSSLYGTTRLGQLYLVWSSI